MPTKAKKESATLKALRKELAAASTAAHAAYALCDRAMQQRHALTMKIREECERRIARECAPLVKNCAVLQKKSDALYAARAAIQKKVNLEESKAFTPPAKGKFTCWKKARIGYREILVKLEIPAKAHRIMALGNSGRNRKCRAEYARVLHFEAVNTPTKIILRPGEEVRSYHDPSFTYAIGAIVKPRHRYSRADTICASGIHFYMNRRDAANH